MNNVVFAIAIWEKFAMKQLISWVPAFCAAVLITSISLGASADETNGNQDATEPMDATEHPARPAATDQAGEPVTEQPPGADLPETEAPPPASPSGPLPGELDTTPPEYLQKPSTLYGIGLNYQFLIVPQFFLKAFLRAAKSDDHNLYRHGFGAHFVRRKKNLDIVVRLMMGFMMSEKDDGNYLGRGHEWDETDYTEFHDLNFLWADVTFIYNWEVAKNFYLGAGGGIGLGWVMGKIYTTASTGCTSSNYDDCTLCRPTNSTCTTSNCDRDSIKQHPDREKAKVPPVLPALNGVFSMRYDIFRHLSARVQAGIFLPGFFMTNVSLEYLF